MDYAEYLVAQAQKQVVETANRNRRKAMQKRIDYYYDGIGDYLDDILKTQFVKVDRLKLQKGIRNILKRVIDKISLLYKSEPTRTLVDDKGNPLNDNIQQRVNDEIWVPAKINSVCSTAEKMMNLCRTVGVKVTVRDDQIKYDIKTPAELEVIQSEDDICEAIGVVYRLPLPVETDKAKKTHKYIVWTKDEHFMLPVDEYGIQGERGILRQKLPIGDNKEMINPYGVIPIAWFRYDHNWRTFFNEGGEDLINAQENLCVKLTELNYLIKMQAFSVPVLKGYDQSKAEPIVIDPTVPIIIPVGQENGDLEFKTPDPKLEAIWKFIVDSVNAIATDYDIAPGSFTLTGSPHSGIELKLENVGLYERAWSKRSFAMDFEKQLWEITKTVGRTEGMKWIPENAKLQVKYDDVQIPEDPEKEQKVWSWDFEHGIKTPIDKIMADNPNMSRQDAEKQWQENIEINKKSGEDVISLREIFGENKAQGGGISGE